MATLCSHAMARKVHAEGQRERQRMKDHTPSGPTLAGSTCRHTCRICGADHGTERHTECPDCGLSPRQFYDGTWGSAGEFDGELPDCARFPFRTDTTWASKRVEIVE